MRTKMVQGGNALFIQLTNKMCNLLSDVVKVKVYIEKFTTINDLAVVLNQFILCVKSEQTMKTRG